MDLMQREHLIGHHNIQVLSQTKYTNNLESHL